MIEFLVYDLAQLSIVIYSEPCKLRVDDFW